MEGLKRNILPHEERLLLPLQLANGVITLLIGFHFLAVTVFLRIRYRKNGIGPEQRKALSTNRGQNSLLLLPDDPAAVPEEMHTRWHNLQANCLETIVIYVITRTVFGLFGLEPFFPLASLVDTLIFLDGFSMVFLLSRLYDTYLALKGYENGSSLTVDISNLLNSTLCIGAATGYVVSFNYEASMEFFLVTIVFILIFLTIFGALSRYKIMQKGGVDFLDSLMDSPSIPYKDYISAERFRTIHRNFFQGLFLFFIPAIFVQPVSSLSLMYKVCLCIYLGCNILWGLFFILGKQPMRTIFWAISTLSMIILYSSYIFELVSDTSESLEYKFVHVAFYMMIFLGLFLSILLMYYCFKYGVKIFPEDHFWIRRAIVEVGVVKVGVLQDAQSCLTESIVILVFALFANELPFLHIQEILRKKWTSIVPILVFVGMTYAHITLSLLPKWRKWSAAGFLLSLFALMVIWTVELYINFTREIINNVV